jgi:hypothetical protein
LTNRLGGDTFGWSVHCPCCPQQKCLHGCDLAASMTSCNFELESRACCYSKSGGVTSVTGSQCVRGDTLWPLLGWTAGVPSLGSSMVPLALPDVAFGALCPQMHHKRAVCSFP